MKPFAVAGLQLELAPSNNIALVEKKVSSVMLRFPWVQMIILSELAVCGTSLSVAEELPSEIEGRLASLAKKFNVWLITGSLYEKAAGQVYNTASVVSPEGDIVARYRKMYPFYPYEKGVSMGTDLCLFDVPNVGSFGLSICYDAWFPETSRALVCAGAEVILHPTLTNTNDRDVECAMARTTAAQQQCYFLDVNGAGEQANGRSIFAGPNGEIIHAAGEREEFIIAEIDIDRVKRSRERGVLGLGQPLKSFRDAGHELSVNQEPETAGYLNSLGELKVPERNN